MEHPRGYCRLTPANPAKIKNMPGGKTDVKDAAWIAQLHRCGLIEGSFVPEEEIRDLRDLTRYRRKLVQHGTQDDTIPGINQDAAAGILAEIGPECLSFLPMAIWDHGSESVRTITKVQVKRKVKRIDEVTKV